MLVRAQDYKGTLLQLERVYNILLELESLKLKLSAIPTGAPLREQVQYFNPGIYRASHIMLNYLQAVDAKIRTYYLSFK